MRRLLLAILVIGMFGTVTELLLLGHTTGVYQLIPIVLIALAFASLVWFSVARSAPSLRAVQALMILFVASGALGAVLHYIRNIADARESDPSLSGTALYVDAVMGSTPALAPGTMVQLGLIGIVFAFRHPVLSAGRDQPSPEHTSI